MKIIINTLILSFFLFFCQNLSSENFSESLLKTDELKISEEKSNNLIKEKINSDCILSGCTSDFKKFEELPKLTDKYFNGSYVIKPLSAYYFNENGIHENLTLNITVKDKTYSIPGIYKDNLQRISFNGESIETEIKKDDFITVELKNEKSSVILKNGLIPFDLDENGIMILKNEKVAFSFLVYNSQTISGNYKIFSKQIKYKHNSSFGGNECNPQIFLDYLIVVHKDKKIQKNISESIDNNYNFNAMYLNDDNEQDTLQVMKFSDDILSLIMKTDFFRCGTDFIVKNYQDTFTINLNTGKKISIEHILNKNALTSFSLCNSIKKTFGENICDNKTNNSLTNFVLTDNKISFITQANTEEEFFEYKYVYPFFLFKDIEGIIEFEKLYKYEDTFDNMKKIITGKGNVSFYLPVDWVETTGDKWENKKTNSIVNIKSEQSSLSMEKYMDSFFKGLSKLNQFEESSKEFKIIRGKEFGFINGTFYNQTKIRLSIIIIDILNIKYLFLLLVPENEFNTNKDEFIKISESFKEEF